MPMLKSQEKMIAAIPPMPENLAWVGGQLVEATRRDEVLAEQKAKVAEWQAQTGFAQTLATLQKQQEPAPARARRAKAAEAIKVTLPRKRAATQAPVQQEAPRPTYREPNAWVRFNDWVDTAKLRRFDTRYGTDLYGEHQTRKLGDKILVMRMATGLDELPKWTKHRRALELAERALHGDIE